MFVTVRSFAKINLGLRIGALRGDGFHELRTVYQTIALHDLIRVEVLRGSGIEIRCADPRVPADGSNTCYRMVERALAALNAQGRVVISIGKRLPVQGGLGGASGNAVAALLGLERALRRELSWADKLRLAAEVGSDLPLFLIGGTVLGVGHGEEVFPLPDLPAVACVVATPEVGVSTPQAFADWDASQMEQSPQRLKPGAETSAYRSAGSAAPPKIMAVREGRGKLTASTPSDRMVELGREFAVWFSGLIQQNGAEQKKARQKSKILSGVPASGRGRAETLLLDLVRTGIENDFEQVVFPKHPELREVKGVLERAGARYASLSGSGSALYGLFGSRAAAEKAVARLRKGGIRAAVTTTLTRPQYWKKTFV